MSDRAKRLAALYRAHEAAEGAERTRLRAEIDRLLADRTPETVDRIAQAAKGETR